MEYILDICPQHTPRTRVNLTTGNVYNTPKYIRYKNAIKWAMVQMELHKFKYNSESLDIQIFFPYPKSTNKKDKIEGRIMTVKPDWDNAGKGITDCMEELEIIKNDSQFWDVRVRKFYTIHKPRIVINIL